MNYNLTTVADTLFGKFLSCALMSNPQAIAEHDMSKLNLELTLDGKPLDFQAVFSAFERQVSPDGTVAVSQQAQQAAPSSDVISSVLDLLVTARDDAFSVNSHVESAVSDVISAAASTAAECASDYASETVSDCAWEHSPGSEVCDEVTGGLTAAIDQLRDWQRSNSQPASA